MDAVIAKLLNAALLGNIEQFKSLLANCGLTWGEIHHPKSKDTSAHISARSGQINFLNYLYSECGKEIFEQENADGKRALHEAAQNGHLECVEFLLEKNVNVDALKHADWTPLMLACTKSNLQVIKILVENDASLKLLNKDGWSCFHIACREGHLHIVTYLLSQDSSLCKSYSKTRRTPLHTAALHNCKEVVKHLLDTGIYTCDECDNCGTTPFMDAIRAGNVDVADMIYEQSKVNIHCIDNNGRQAIHLAAEAGSTASILYLQNIHQVCVDAATEKSKNTPLQLASKEAHEDAVILLLELGADVNAQDKKERTALHISVGAQHYNVTKILLESGAKNLPDSSGNTPCDLARTPKLKELFQNFVT